MNNVIQIPTSKNYFYKRDKYINKLTRQVAINRLWLFIETVVILIMVVR